MELEVLGLKLKIRPEQVDEQISPEEVAEFVRSEGLKIKEQNPRLEEGQIAVLVALDLARNYKLLMSEYRESVHSFKESANSALQYIECE
ncbi:MAG: cell division protein ZapA [Bacteriovoracaceae bacterium]|nr:cell division protein ZapA [Bacteriovoracaceae bacterium]